MEMRMSIASFVFALLLTGCAGCAPKIDLALSNSDLGHNPKTVNILLEPFETLGIPESSLDEVCISTGVFPDILFGEYYPGRIRWRVVASDDGKNVYLGEALFSGIDFSGRFVFTYLIDGRCKRDCRMLVLSTLVEYAYNPHGEEIKIKDRGKLLNDPQYLREFIVKNGASPISFFSSTDKEKVLATFRSWNAYETKKGIFLSPVKEEEIREIAGINPAYNFYEKMIFAEKCGIYMDPIATAVGVGLDIFHSANTPSLGWDYTSQLPSRRTMGLIIEYALKLKQRLIEKINLVNAALIPTLR